MIVWRIPMVIQIANWHRKCLSGDPLSASLRLGLVRQLILVMTALSVAGYLPFSLSKREIYS